MNHKAGGASQYPVGTTYQQTPQGQYLLDDLYTGSMAKNNSGNIHLLDKDST